MTQETPLIFTSKGNVPADTLTYRHEWTVTPEFIKFREFYVDNATGEIVKDSTHAYVPQGVLAGSVAGAF